MIGRRAFWSNNNDVGNGFEQQSDPMPQPSQRINFKSALEDIHVPNSFERGIAMFKVGSYGRLEPVTLTLSKDRFIISILPRKIERVGGNGSSLLRPSILSRVRSGASQTSMGSIGGDSIDGSVASDSIGVLSLLSDTDVDIGSIDRLQSGQMTLKFELARRKEKKQSISQRNAMGIPMLDESKCFSLIFRGAETLDLMVDDGGDREEVLYILNSIIGQYESSKLKVGNEVLLLRYIWNDVDRDDSNTINEKEMGELLNRINFHVKEKSTGAMYQKFVKTLGLTKAQRKQGLTFDQCVTLLHKTKRDTWQVKPVTQLFYDMFGQFMTKNKIRKKVSATSFLNRFLLTVQGEENMTMDNVMQIFAKLHQLELADVSNHITEQTYISLEQFEAYLLSRDNDIFNPRREQVCKSSEMSKPLSEYWINSSHNTYLTGDQLTSRSSVEMYTKALYRGCRCLELDVWDGAKDEFGNPMPVVYHGRTLTSKIMFEDIIKSLDVFLMLNPKSYPIILSLENHCSIPFQQAMATQLKSILGSRLYVPDESSLRGSLPSPAQLRGKIVLKGRRPSTGLTDDYDTDDDAADDDLTEMQSVRTEKTSVTGNTKKAQKSVKIAPELAKLTLFHGTKFKSWGESEQALTHHMHSFSESRVRYFCKHNQLQRWIKYNQTHISRTFPSGRRTDSSNYNPILAWSTGCQMGK
jgi:phosphatidylinositol phospholipase C delta